MSHLLLWLSVAFQLISVIMGCMEPVPDYLTQIDETDGPGTIVLTMSDPPSSPPSSWSIAITSPSGHAAYLQDYFLVIQNSSAPLEWRVVLAKALDVERIKGDSNFILADLTLEVQCSTTNSQSVIHYQRTVIVRAVSEFPPVVASPLPRFNVSEDSNIGTVVVSLGDYVTDEDVQNNGQVSDIGPFAAFPYIGPDLINGADTFIVTNVGEIILQKPIDYENGELSFGLNVTVQDTGGLTTWSLVEIDVINANDNPPRFVVISSRGTPEQVAEYRATVEETFTGSITLEPGHIKAIDPDNDVIGYYIKTGYPDDYSSYISVDPSTGAVTLVQSVSDPSISHFTLIVEARDNSPSQRSGDSNQGHSTTASLLVFVSGRSVGFPATPRSGSSSTIASVNSDALFISVIVLSAISFIFIIVTIILCCKIKRKNRQKDTFPGIERCNTLKERKSSDWSVQVQMRPVERGNSEKDFMRSLSNPRNTPYVNEGFVNDKVNDDVFTTGITPYNHSQLTNNNNQRTSISAAEHDVIARGIMPYDEHAIVARHSSTTLPRTTPLNPPAPPEVSYTTSSSQFASIQTPSMRAPNANNNNFDSLDLLTSVKPITEADMRPIKLTIHQSNDNNNNSNNIIKPNNNTRQSLNSADVMNELDQIILNENQYNSDRGEKITHFTNESTTDYLSRNQSEIESESSNPVHSPRAREEGITSFVRDSIDFGVLPFDHTNNTSSVGSVKASFHFPGEQQRPSTPGNPFRNDPMLNSADIYYRQNSESQNTK